MRTDQQGVSAVLGVLLLIIIVVALAVSITLFGQRINDQADDQETPSIGFSKVADRREVHVVRAEGELDWAEHFRFGATCAPTLNGGPMPVVAGTPVNAGDVLGCGPDETLSIRSSPSFGNALLYETTFD